ncbi:MAG: beta-agarase [Chloroflexi bacterium]|nr:beta-agarase [Chloroflexota bacterium]
MNSRREQLQYLLWRGRGSDLWFHRRNQDFETKLGFFRVQVVNKRWWIIDPDNQPFVSLGICHIAYKGERPITISADTDPTGYSPYIEACDRRYGGDPEVWAAFQAKRLRRWGFNTVGSWSSVEMFRQGLVYTVMLGMARTVQPNYWLEGSFPDVWSETFSSGIDQVAAQQCAPRKDDPLLLGYFLDNEFDWYGHRQGKSMLARFMSLDAQAPGKRALVELLRERHGGQIGHLNNAWDLDLQNFEQVQGLEALCPGPRADAGAVAADEEAFVGLVAERYFAECERAIRTVDPNHMILGVRFAGVTAPISVIEACGRHCEIISVNNYSYDAPVEALQTVFDATWRPIMITEWSFKAMDSGLPNTKGAAIPVYTQEDRAEGYERYATQALSVPCVVGLHWFQYTDQPLLGRALDGENSNYGVVDVRDEPYSTLVERMRVVNARAIEIAKAVHL